MNQGGASVNSFTRTIVDEINAKSAQTGLKIDRTRLYVTGVRHVDTYYTKT